MTLPETAATVTPIHSPLLVNTEQAAKILGIGRDNTYKMLRNGTIKSVQVGNRRYVPVVELHGFIARATGGQK